MTYTISQDRSKLTIKADENERQYLRDNFADEPSKSGADIKSIHADQSMHEVLEHITCNSELEWIPEGTTGDLTSAPMLGIYGMERPFVKEDETIQHRITGPNMIEELESYWAFADYQVRSVLQNLMEYGEVVFVDRF